MTQPKQPPTREQIAALEPFVGLDLPRIMVVRSAAQAQSAFEDLARAGEVGFDTESKPTFFKGQKSEGPHVVQFSTLERAYIFQPHVHESLPAIMGLLESTEIKKIGFGLRGDLSHISNRFSIRAGGVVDLDRSFRMLGYRNSVGAKSAIAILFQQRMSKSKSITTSNWSAMQLSEKQLVYAANDAYVAIKVHHALNASGVAR
ncbi:MAG: 3'-5' exonuclease [Verrucomicrobiota bacterium]